MNWQRQKTKDKEEGGRELECNESRPEIYIYKEAFNEQKLMVQVLVTTKPKCYALSQSST